MALIKTDSKKKQAAKSEAAYFMCALFIANWNHARLWTWTMAVLAGNSAISKPRAVFVRERQKSDKLDLETAIWPDVFVALFKVFLFVSFSSAQPNVKFNITHFLLIHKVCFSHRIQHSSVLFSFFSLILVQFF